MQQGSTGPHESEALVVLDVADGIAQIRINRPQAMNAIDVAVAQHLLDAVRRIQSDSDVRVVVLSGAGRSFMAGGDLQAFLADAATADRTAVQILDPLNEALALLAEGDAPVIAAVHGGVAGAGMSIALGADMAIASSDAKFVMAYSKIGASLDAGGSWALARIVGLHRAMEIALLSEPIDAARALELGLVNRIVEPASLQAETMTLARRLAQGPTHAYGRIRRLIRQSFDRDYRAQLEAEKQAFAAGARTADFVEGIGAFLEKRAPRYTGKGETSVTR